MFERLMNLDVELMCLGTKAFVAKEQLKNKILYSKPRKNDEPEEVFDTEEEYSGRINTLENQGY